MGCWLLICSTKTPPLESCTKNLPSQLVSAAVTIPFTKIGTPNDASLAGSANTSEVFVSASFTPATTGKSPQTNKRKKTNDHEAERFFLRSEEHTSELQSLCN